MRSTVQRRPTAATGRARRTAPTALALISGLVTIVGSLLLPLAPVEVDHPTVSWPLVATAPVSTLLPLEADIPLGLKVGFSCRAVAEASASGSDADGIVAPVSYTVAFGFGPACSLFSVTNGGTWTAEVGGLLGSNASLELASVR